MPARKTIDREAITRLTNEGLTGREIAAQLGYTEPTVSRIRKELGISPGHLPLPAERLQRIQGMLDDGWSWLEIYRSEGAHRETMERYFPGTQWTLEQMKEHRRSLRVVRKWAAQDTHARRFGASI